MCGLMVEFLKLKLAQIEARLALKRKERKLLQQQKKGWLSIPTIATSKNKPELSALQVPQSPQKSPPKRTPPRSFPFISRGDYWLLLPPRFSYPLIVLCTVSLVWVLTLAAIPTSPQRVLLGIDRGKKASEVSLKNPWKPPTTTPEKPKSTFADRLAVAARENKRKSTIQDERERKKARTFSATALASTLSHPSVAPQTTLSDVSQTATPSHHTRAISAPHTLSSSTSKQATALQQVESTTTALQDQEEWCKYTGFNLRSRRLPQSVLKEEFKGKTTYSVSDLYRLVTPPSFDPPEYDTLDFLVTGIVAQKSPVRQVKGRGENYLVVKITDLKVRYPCCSLIPWFFLNRSSNFLLFFVLRPYVPRSPLGSL